MFVSTQSPTWIIRSIMELLYSVILLVTLVIYISPDKVQIGVLLPYKPVSLVQEACFPMLMVKPGIEIALSKVNNNFTFHDDYKFKFVPFYMDSECSDVVGPLKAMEIILAKGGVDTFFGPCCKYALAPVGRYNIKWNKPILTPGGFTSSFSNKSEFNLLTRIIGTDSGLVSALITTMNQFHFRHFFVIYHNNFYQKGLGNSRCDFIGRAFKEYTIERDGYWTSYSGFDEKFIHTYNWDDVFLEIKNKSRGRLNILFLCTK